MINMEAKAKKMASIVKEIEDVKRAKSETAKDYGEQLAALWNRLEALSGDVENEQMSIDEAKESIVSELASHIEEKVAELDAEEDEPDETDRDTMAKALEEDELFPADKQEQHDAYAAGYRDADEGKDGNEYPIGSKLRGFYVNGWNSFVLDQQEGAEGDEDARPEPVEEQPEDDERA